MRPRRPRRRALVLAGGGMRVSYQAGVLLALDDAGLAFELLDGTSGGTINLAMRMSGLSPTQMCERWRSLNPLDFGSPLSLRDAFSKGGLPGFGDADGIVDKVFPHLGIDVDRIRRARGVEATFNVCNYTDKLNVAVPHAEVALEQLIAGISLPMFMPAVPYDGKIWVDSVWIKDANLREVVRRGAEEVWVVWCIGNIAAYNPGTLDQYVHMIEISANAGLFDELAHIEQINAGIAAGQTGPGGQREPIIVHMIKPQYALPLDPDYALGHIDAQTLIARGYADAWRYFDHERETGIALNSDATKMLAIVGGVSFCEHFDDEASTMVFRASATIPDLDAFIEDPSNAGQLHGSIDVPELGAWLHLADGRFWMTRASDGSVRVEYEASIHVHGSRYQLRAHKLLRDDPGPDLWADFGTLHVLVSKQGQVVSQGTLQSREGMTGLLTNTHAIGARGAGAASRAVARFVGFYAGELYRTHLRSNRPWWKFWAGWCSGAAQPGP